jgi:hypothetical protein
MGVSGQGFSKGRGVGRDMKDERILSSGSPLFLTLSLLGLEGGRQRSKVTKYDECGCFTSVSSSLTLLHEARQLEVACTTVLVRRLLLGHWGLLFRPDLLAVLYPLATCPRCMYTLAVLVPEKSMELGPGGILSRRKWARKRRGRNGKSWILLMTPRNVGLR